MEAPRTAMISGHIDITPAQFNQHYAPALTTASERGDYFIISNSVGADSMALSYLRARVPLNRIKIYLHTPRGGSSKVEAALQRQGLFVQIVQGSHTARDAVMTEESDYDILWVRSEDETRALYGAKYRPGRVSGTQKNQDRRAAKDRRLTSQATTLTNAADL